eukprot:scaffold177180_cov17-Tisochrysis_lutea.AAC.1
MMTEWVQNPGRDGVPTCEHPKYRARAAARARRERLAEFPIAKTTIFRRNRGLGQSRPLLSRLRQPTAAQPTAVGALCEFSAHSPEVRKRQR